MPIGMQGRAIVTELNGIRHVRGSSLFARVDLRHALHHASREVHGGGAPMHFNDIVRVASCGLGRFWLRDLSTIHLPSIGEWLWRRVSRPVQRGVSYDVSISENEESRTLPTYT